MGRKGLVSLGVLALLGLAGYSSGFAQVALQQVLSFIEVQGTPVAASPPLLSEHEIQALDQMTPQAQAERLLERAINHYQGATEWIDKRVDSWYGALQVDTQLNTLLTSAFNSDDLRVRAAAIEIDLAAYNIRKTPESVTVRILQLDSGEGDRISALWQLGLLGNRGVEQDRIFPVLLKYTRDSDARVRHWAVEGLAYLGADATIEPLLEIFRTDPSAEVRERAACGLAQSGMLQQSQRMKAVPVFLNYLEDPSLDPTMHQWVLQALEDISGQRLGDDPAAWRRWYNSNR